MKLKGKVIVVTGGAGLLGSAFCESISSEGGIAIVADTNLKKAKEVSDLIENADFVELDITSKISILSAIEYLKNKYSRIDAVINNAYPRNKNYGRHFFDVEYKDFCENMNLNLGGYFLTSQLFLKYFTENNGGNVINIASIYGVVAPRFNIYKETKMTTPVEYAVIKSGLIHLTKYMTKYFGGTKIRINSISPGGILDNQPESFLKNYKEYCTEKGMLNPSDLCGTLVFMLSDDSKYINGQNIIVDDGFTL